MVGWWSSAPQRVWRNSQQSQHQNGFTRSSMEVTTTADFYLCTILTTGRSSNTVQKETVDISAVYNSEKRILVCSCSFSVEPFRATYPVSVTVDCQISFFQSLRYLSLYIVTRHTVMKKELYGCTESGTALTVKASRGAPRQRGSEVIRLRDGRLLTLYQFIEQYIQNGLFGCPLLNRE